MARRTGKSPWGKVLTAKSLMRSWGSLARATMRGSRALSKAAGIAAPASTTRRAPRSGTSQRGASTSSAAGWTVGTAVSSGVPRRYRLYRPPGSRKSVPLPLLVMLHGCGQDADRFARSTRMHRLAAADRFLVLYPEQERFANPQGCWNWFEMRSGRALAEVASILAAIDQVCATQGGDPSRVALAGFSAGASMAGLMAACHPQRFKAVAMHSGVAPGAAYSTATALSAMRGRRSPGPLPQAPGDPPPPLLLIHGTSDHIVAASNAGEAARQWAAAWGATAEEPRTVQRGARHSMLQTDFKAGARVVVSLCEIESLGHAWSGGATGQSFSDAKGPDASRMIWAFAARQFRSR